MRKSYRNIHILIILSLLGLGGLACHLAAGSSGTRVPSPSPSGSETLVISRQPTLSTGTPTRIVTATREVSIHSPLTPSPTFTVEMTPKPTHAIAPTPTQLVLQGPVISYNGISFTLAPALGDKVFIMDTASDSHADVTFSLMPGGHCRDVGCVTVYPVASYREEVLFGDDIIDGLTSAIAEQSNSYFPVLMAHILLRAQTQFLRFQNGMGMRALVIKGQDTVWANNASIVYEFHGLTDDGQYYVVVTFPIDAPILLSTHDPAENVNEAAIPVPELPGDDGQLGAVMRTYNEEVQRQLDVLDSANFKPDLGLLDALVDSLLVMPSIEPSSVTTGDVGFLHVEIDYRGTWYRKTFSYTRQAEHIRHFVLVMPESHVDRATADQVFSSIDFSSGVLSVREGREALAWALDYVYEAPGGYFRGQFDPGTYYVAAAFVAAPIDREETGQPDDAILYAGITGGGASTDYQKIAIGPGENAITLRLTDRDGWACPWLYVYNGHAFEKRTEILRDIQGKQHEQTEISSIGLVDLVDGTVTLRVAEEKREITFIDELYIIVDGIEVRMEANAHSVARVTEKDEVYLVLTRGESIEFSFRLPASLIGRDRAMVSVVVTGFYVPMEE